ncbi:hypothetical protein D3C76_1846830 [compost metagenome]
MIRVAYLAADIRNRNVFAIKQIASFLNTNPVQIFTESLLVMGSKIVGQIRGIEMKMVGQLA